MNGSISASGSEVDYALKPLLVIDGMPVRYKHFERCVTVIENIPDAETLMQTYTPGQQYTIIWHRNGKREVIPGAAVRSVRRSGRMMLSLCREAIAE